ncbi:MAG: HEAT repeat domain-containing protein, partial [Pseudomonadota bacterium]
MQVAAIEALATLDVTSSVDALIRARADEMGQELDPVVFKALAAIGDGGLSALIGFVRDANPKTRERAIAAIAKADPDRLRPLLGLLLGDDSAAVRVLAIRVLDATDPEAADLALRDPSPVVRRTALAAFAPARADLARRALADGDEECVAIALAALPDGEPDDAEQTLATNAMAWAATARSRLATAALSRLAALQGASALPVLVAHGANADRPMESRVAALQEIARIGGDPAVDALAEAMTDRTRQVRAAALAGLAEIALRSGDQPAATARAALLDAMTGHAIAVEETAETPTPKPAAPPSTRRIRTTAEGEIVFEELAPEEVVPAPQGPSSTLEALDWGDGTTIPAAPATPEPEEGTGEDVDELHGGDAAVRAPKAGGRKRVAVDGPDNVADDL